jgi:C4-dicarboxylate-specific signal transduction histidine kinase
MGELLETLAKVAGQTERAAAIVRRLRAFVRKSEPRLDPVDINTIIREAVVFTEIEAKQKRVALRLALGDALPPVRADTIQIEQVLVNLLRNGIEATAGVAEGERALTVKTTLTEPHTVEVAVSDSGPGLEPERIECVFDPFVTTNPRGVGLGLSISRSIVEDTHGGRLWATPNADRGVTFRFTLPIAARQDGEDAIGERSEHER